MDIDNQMLERFKKVYNKLVDRKRIIKGSRTKSKRAFAEKIFGQKLTHVLDRYLKRYKLISNNHKDHKPFFIEAEDGLRFLKVRHRISAV